MVNDDTLSLFCEVLDFPDVTTALVTNTTLDIEVLLDFIVHVCYFS